VFTSSCLYGVHVFLTLCVCACAKWCPTHIVLCFSVFVCLVFCVPYVASFSGLSIIYCSFGILWRLLECAVNFPSLTNWFHFTIWETRIAETGRVLYNYSSTLSITTCTCKVPITCLPACTCKVPITCLPACTCKVTITCLPACTCKVTITCLPASPARSCWTFGHCDFVTKTYFK
jgi:hypothetical protein